MLTRLLKARLPEGTQYLVDRPMRIRLVFVVLGSVLVAGLEMVALASILPLVSLLTSGELGSPALEGLLARFGAVTVPEQTVAFAVVIVLAFLLKAILVLAFRWWTMGFTNQNLIRTSATLLRYYLRADYGLHLTRTVGTLVNNVTGTSSMAYTGVVNASVTFLTEAVTLVAVAVVVGVSMPLTGLGMALYFLAVAWVIKTVIRRPASRLGWTLVTTGERANTAALQGLENYKDVKIRGNDSAFMEEYRAARAESAEATRLKMILTMMPRYVLEVAFVAAIAALVAVAFIQGRGGEAFGSLALLAMAGFRVLPSMAALMATTNEIRTSWPAFERTTAELAAAQPVLHAAERRNPRCIASTAACRLPRTRAVYDHPADYRRRDSDVEQQAVPRVRKHPPLRPWRHQRPRRLRPGPAARHQRRVHQRQDEGHRLQGLRPGPLLRPARHPGQAQQRQGLATPDVMRPRRAGLARLRRREGRRSGPGPALRTACCSDAHVMSIHPMQSALPVLRYTCVTPRSRRAGLARLCGRRSGPRPALRRARRRAQSSSSPSTTLRCIASR